MNGRIVVALVFLVGGAGVAFAGAQPEASLTPSEAHEAAEGHARVKGVVEAVDRKAGTFTLGGDGEQVRVQTDRLPSAVTAGNSLLAEGTLTHDEGGPVLEAEEIQMGCPSKYEA